MDPPKKPPVSPASTWQDEGLEFEITDFGEARRILDDESIAQFHVATAMSPAQWKRLRRATLPTDRALSGRAIDWLLSLPPGVRPEKIGSQFPRIANALAGVWDEPGECQAALDKLFDDGRTGRIGFPPGVQNELLALRDWMTGLRGWNESF
ncbi:MAG: hypothetical protein ABI460_21365 [Caldimonas sp.]